MNTDNINATLRILSRVKASDAYFTMRSQMDQKPESLDQWIAFSNEWHQYGGVMGQYLNPLLSTGDGILRTKDALADWFGITPDQVYQLLAIEDFERVYPGRLAEEIQLDEVVGVLVRLRDFGTLYVDEAKW